jgi:hypothetical protein
VEIKRIDVLVHRDQNRPVIKTRTKEKQEPSKILLGFEEQTMGERTESTDSSRNKKLKQAAMHKLGRV